MEGNAIEIGDNSWSSPKAVAAGYGLDSISCPTINFCLAVSYGGIFVTANFSPPATYTALGDSYSSGEGLPPFMPGTDTSTDFCHRSQNDAYSDIAATVLHLKLNFHACSGAKTYNILSLGQHGEKRQIKDVSSSDALVTLTIGGNDIGFSSILMSCAELDLGASPFSKSCVDNTKFTTAIETVIANTYYNWLKTFEKLRSSGSADTSVIALDYPHLFPTATSAQNCFQLSPYFTLTDQAFFNDMTDFADEVEAVAAFDAGINFVDVKSIYNHHAVCGSKGAWINGVENPLNGANGSFHPNIPGQLGYEQALFDYITNYVHNLAPLGLPLTSHNLPSNPPPGIDPPAQPAPVVPPLLTKLENTTPTETFGEVSLQPLTADFSSSCEGIYKAGQIMNVSASGFSPGSRVKIQLVAGKKHGDSAEFHVNADSNGYISTAIRIPVTFKGFIVGNSSNGMLFVSVKGHSSNSTKVSDTDFVSIAGKSSSCGVVDNLGFKGFFAPVLNSPKVNNVQAGSVIPLRFSLPGIKAPIGDVTDLGFPVSGPTNCNSIAPSSTTPTNTASSFDSDKSDRQESDHYLYLWRTDPKWRGCRVFEIKLTDGSMHTAVFNFTAPHVDNENWLSHIFQPIKRQANAPSNKVKHRPHVKDFNNAHT